MMTAAFSALPAGVGGGTAGPADAHAGMIPFPGWWTGKIICMKGQPLQQAGLCGDGGGGEVA